MSENEVGKRFTVQCPACETGEVVIEIEGIEPEQSATSFRPFIPAFYALKMVEGCYNCELGDHVAMTEKQYRNIQYQLNDLLTNEKY